jgi:hypothetical protein
MTKLLKGFTKREMRIYKKRNQKLIPFLFYLYFEN